MTGDNIPAFGGVTLPLFEDFVTNDEIRFPKERGMYIIRVCINDFLVYNRVLIQDFNLFKLR